MQRAGSIRPPRRRPGVTIAMVMTALLPLIGAMSASAATLDRIRQAGKITFGYRVDARPFSYQDTSGAPTGYSVTLCEKVAEEVKAELGLPDLGADWVPVTLEDRFTAVAQGKVDLLCEADSITLSRRKEVAFSVPIFPSGIGAFVRADELALEDALSGRPSGPIWRASPARILETKTFSAVDGTTSETWLADRLDKFQLPATVRPVENYDAGIAKLLEGDTDVLFGDRAILLEAAARNPAASKLVLVDRLFTYELLALTLARNDDDFRLVVDKALSKTFTSPDFQDVYVKWFGPPTEGARLFFLQSVLPE